MSDRIRTFVAVPVEPTAGILEVLDHFASIGASVRPVCPESLHITVKFLGTTPSKQIDEIEQVLCRTATAYSAHSLTLTGLSAFPDEECPAIVWIGIRNSVTLTNIAHSLENALEPKGFAREGRDYCPHLTIGRVRVGDDIEVSDRVKTLLAKYNDADFGTAELNRIALYRSELSPTGPQYSQLADVQIDQRPAS